MDAQLLGIISESETPSDSTTETPEPQSSAVEAPEQTAPEADIAVPVPDPVAPEPVQSEGFQFLGKTWESLAKAEEVLGSQEGRISKTNEELAQSRKQLGEYWEYVQAVSRENDEYRRAMEEREKGKVEEAKAEQGNGREQWMKQVKLAMQIAQQRGIDPNEVLMHAIEDRLVAETDKRITERIEASTGTLREIEEGRQVAQAQQTIFKWAQGQGRNGQALYPELQKDALYHDGQLQQNDNRKFVENLYEIFNHFAAQNPQFAYSGPGFDYAYRLAKEYSGTPSTRAAVADTSAPPRDEKGRFLPNNGAARAASELSGTTPSLERPTRDSVQERLQELKAHSTIKRGTTDLGFYE